MRRELVVKVRLGSLTVEEALARLGLINDAAAVVGVRGAERTTLTLRRGCEIELNSLTGVRYEDRKR